MVADAASAGMEPAEWEDEAATAGIAARTGLGALAARTAATVRVVVVTQPDDTSQMTSSPTSSTRKPIMKIQPSALILPLRWWRVPSVPIVPLTARRFSLAAGEGSGARPEGAQPVFLGVGFVTRGSGMNVTVYINRAVR